MSSVNISIEILTLLKTMQILKCWKSEWPVPFAPPLPNVKNWHKKSESGNSWSYESLPLPNVKIYSTKNMTWYGLSGIQTPKFWAFSDLIFGNTGGKEELSILGGLISQVTIFLFPKESVFCVSMWIFTSINVSQYTKLKGQKQIVAVEYTNITAPNCIVYKHLLFHRSLLSVILCIIWKTLLFDILSL